MWLTILTYTTLAVTRAGNITKVMMAAFNYDTGMWIGGQKVEIEIYDSKITGVCQCYCEHRGVCVHAAAHDSGKVAVK